MIKKSLEKLLINSLKFNFVNFHNHKIKEYKKEYIKFFPGIHHCSEKIKVDNNRTLYVVKEKGNNYFDVYDCEGMWFTKYTILNYKCFLDEKKKE